MTIEQLSQNQKRVTILNKQDIQTVKEMGGSVQFTRQSPFIDGEQVKAHAMVRMTMGARFVKAVVIIGQVKKEGAQS